ncbi:trypsin-like serine peptidase [Jannaschia sp. R86511]|uniref:trypsin-like serine peptidase n=1 Tax=Jannaschia sp. R86511 TaxID=3093853 RepID=UPI0036D3C095
MSEDATPDPHTPVGNEPPGSDHALQEGPSEPPATGDAAGVADPTGDVEQVAGLVVPPPAVERVQESAAPDTAALQDVAAASFGAARESVLGTDDRVRVEDTAAYPWRVHASLLITAADGSSWVGTGWFIGPRTLVTAGHCVYITGSNVPGRDGWARSIQVMPGRQGSTLPYGSVTSTSFRSVRGWTVDGSEHFDYGAIVLPTPLGSTVGWFGYGVYSDAQLQDSTVNVSGYPGDKPAGTQWYHANRVSGVNATKVFYTADTMGGQSGSAVYQLRDGARYAVAVHAYGGASANSGTRINRQVFDNLGRWRA